MEERVWSRETEVQKSPGAEEPKHQGVQGLPLYRRQFQDGRSKGMGTEWDKEVVGNVDPQKRVLCLAQVFLSPFVKVSSH